jgi:hypothetical protein
MHGSGPPGCGLDARLTTLLCKKMFVAKSKYIKPDAIGQNFLRKAMAQEGLFSQ